MTNEEVWLRFACAVASGRASDDDGLDVEAVAYLADALVKEYEKRHGERAIIAKGIRQCDGCGSTNLEGCAYGEAHGVIKAYCTKCLDTAEKGELPTNQVSQDTCSLCGQTRGTMFTCPGRFPPYHQDQVLTEEEQAIDAKWRSGLMGGKPHSWDMP